MTDFAPLRAYLTDYARIRTKLAVLHTMKDAPGCGESWTRLEAEARAELDEAGERFLLAGSKALLEVHKRDA